MKTHANSLISKSFNARPKKRLGQNFLKDGNIADRIVSLSGAGTEDHVLEIGAGTGVLTFRLAPVCKKLTAVETDAALIPGLTEKASAFPNITIINNDILKTDLRELAEGSELKVVANLPYYITTPVIMKLLEEDTMVTSITVMVQKEAAERLTAEPGSTLCGAISYAVSWYCKTEDLLDVPPSAFYPQPKVQSRVIQLTRRTEPPASVSDPAAMFRLIRASFSQRRKTLVNSGSTLPEYDKEDIKTALQQAGLNENIRGEALTLDQFAELSDILCGIK